MLATILGIRVYVLGSPNSGLNNTDIHYLMK